jgi:hypothetical protein
MKWFVVKGFKYKTSTFNRHMPHGWGNGYVAVPPSHPLWGVDYNNVEQIDVHGGLTYSEMNDVPGLFVAFPEIPTNYWVFGFDTKHWDDTLKTWPKKAVEAETKRLFCQLMDIEIGEL